VQGNVQELIRTNPGKIRLFFKHNPLPFHTRSMQAHEAAMAAGAQGKFWQMHDLLFANQGRLGKDDLLQYAKQLNLDVELFQHALDTHLYRPIVDANIEEAQGLGVIGTPTFFINGKKIVGAQNLETLTAAVDEALQHPPGPGAVSPPNGNTAGRAAEALPALVERVEIRGSHIRGAIEAPVTVVEFSDFQCPFCGRAAPTVQELLRQYPKGVRWVFKNFPLDFHPGSLLAHKAALAAGEQGKFWEMHDLIFANPNAIKRDDLIQRSSQLGLDMKRFIADLDGNRYQAIIDAEKAEGLRLGVTGTPTFFINGKRMVGAWPLAEYSKLVDAELKPAHDQRVAAEPPLLVVSSSEARQPASRPSSAKRLLKDGVATRGPETAPITITWYCDLESPLSLQAAQVVSRLEASYPEKIRVEFRNLPLEFHSHAAIAHQAMLAAGAQGKFWQMQYLILADQSKMTRDDLLAYAQTLGLDRTRFIAALDGRLFQPVIDEDTAEAHRQGVYGVPVFFVNGKRMDGVQPLAMFKEIIDAELARAQTSASGQ